MMGARPPRVIEDEIYERSATIAAKTLIYTYEYQHFGESARCRASPLVMEEEEGKGGGEGTF